MIRTKEEYDFVEFNEDPIIIDGGVMPLRTLNNYGVNSQYCLRGEDPAFLMETDCEHQHALGNIPPHRYMDRVIRSDRMVHIANNIQSYYGNRLFVKQLSKGFSDYIFDTKQLNIINLYNLSPGTAKTKPEWFEEGATLERNDTLCLFDDFQKLRTVNNFQNKATQLQFTHSTSSGKTHEDSPTPFSRPNRYQVYLYQSTSARDDGVLKCAYQEDILAGGTMTIVLDQPVSEYLTCDLTVVYFRYTHTTRNDATGTTVENVQSNSYVACLISSTFQNQQMITLDLTDMHYAVSEMTNHYEFRKKYPEEYTQGCSIAVVAAYPILHLGEHTKWW